MSVNRVAGGGAAPRAQQSAPESLAPQYFWDCLAYISDHWSRADVSSMAQPLNDKPALANILWTMQKLKAASNQGDTAGIRSNVEDMRRRIDEGVRNGWLNASDAQALRNIAGSFLRGSGGPLSAKGEVGPAVSSALKQLGHRYYDMSEGEMMQLVQRFSQSKEGQALRPEVREKVEQALWSSYRTARQLPFSRAEAKQHLAQLGGQLQELEGMARKGLISRESLAPLREFATRYQRSIAEIEAQAPGVASQREEQRKQLYSEARDVLGKLERIDEFRRSKNGWYSSGGYLASAAELSLRSLDPLRRALSLPDNDPNKEGLVRRELDIARERLKSFPKGQDPAAVLNTAREDNLKALSKAGDVAGLIPGPVGKILSFAFKETEAGIRYASGDISGQELLVKTLFNTVGATLGGKIAGTGGLFSQALREAAYSAVKDFANDAAKILANDKLSPQERAAALDRAFKGAIANAYAGAVTGLLGKLTDGIESEDKKALVDYAIKIAQKFGIDPLVDGQIDKLKAIPEKKK